MTKQTPGPTRDERLENLIMNHSMIFMGMFEEALSDIAEKITEAFATGASAMAGALAGVSSGSGSEAADMGRKKLKEMSPEVKTQIGHVFSEIREEMASHWPKIL